MNILHFKDCKTQREICSTQIFQYKTSWFLPEHLVYTHFSFLNIFHKSHCFPMSCQSLVQGVASVTILQPAVMVVCALMWIQVFTFFVLLKQQFSSKYFDLNVYILHSNIECICVMKMYRFSILMMQLPLKSWQTAFSYMKVHKLFL